MTVRRAFAAALALSLALVAPPPAQAEDPNAASCSSSWTGGKTCHFLFEGFPLVVWGTVASGSPAWIRVQMALADDPEAQLPLVECTDTGQSSACSNGIPDESTYLHSILLRQAWLVCEVEGHRAGSFGCSSGGGT